MNSALEPDDCIELRVHGIGDHDDWSELGTPRLVKDGSPRGPDVAEPPRLPGHPLLLINWSRTSRKRTSWKWYLALPFTLVNAAGYMCQSSTADKVGTTSGPAERQVRFVTVVTGLLLTVITYVWLVAIVETIARRSFLPVTSTTTSGTGISIGVGTLLALAIAIRRLFPGAKCPLSVYLLNLAVVVAATVATVAVRPAHRAVTADWVPSLFTTHGPSKTFTPVAAGQPAPTFQERLANGELIPYLDALTTTSVIAITITFLLVLGLLLRSAYGKFQGHSATPAWGSAIALMSGVVLMISVASAVRLFVDNFVAYLSRRDLLPLGDPVKRAPYEARVMLPPLNVDYAEHNDYVMDLLPLIGILGVLALLIALLVANLPPYGAGRPRRVSKRRQRKKPTETREAACWRRRLVLRLPSTLPSMTVIGGLLWAGAAIEMVYLLMNGSVRIWEWVVVGVQGVSVLAIVVIIAGRRLETVAKPLAMFADLLGFWPVASHPLAGASYRRPVVDGIVSQVEGSTAGTRMLVGHSQGSVLCAWAVQEIVDTPGRRKVDLVTCGSPLQSLYAAFFPSYFDDAFFGRVRANTEAWANFWRDTDPIATELTSLAGSNYLIEDPDGDGALHIHGDYWISTDQTAYIAGRIAAGAIDA